MQEEINISTSEEKGWLGKIKDSIYENWQTILVALVVLIVGVSAYNYNTKNDSESSLSAIEENFSEENTGDEAAEEEEYVEEQDQEDAAVEENQTAAEEEKTEEIKLETKTEEQNTNAVENSGEGYKVAAIRGEGITHLARKAIAAYLSENSDSEVTALHKIYAEDYLKDRIGSQGIEIGHEETFSKAIIQEAIASSKKLSQTSLNNLKKYETNIR